MSLRIPTILFVLFAAIAIFCQQAWVPGFHADGLIYAALGKNAALEGHWLVPHLSESVSNRFSDHPPLYIILMGTFFKIFGVGFTQARVFGALFGVGSVLLIYLFLKSNKQERWALFTAMILILTQPFFKKVRFPNMDIPLALTSIAAYWCYYRAHISSTILKWMLVGLFFGLSLLIKGPFGVLLPLTIFTHMLLTKNFFKFAKDPAPYIGLLLGFTVFAIWPMSLYLTGNIDIFIDYLESQFLWTIVKARGTQTLDPFAYLVFILKFCTPWVALASFGAFKAKSEKQLTCPLYLLFVSWFISGLLLLSMQKFKFSHYILSLYPALAALAAYPLSKLSEKIQDNITKGFQTLTVLTALVLLVFPATTEVRRNKEVIQGIELTKLLPERPIKWVLVNDGEPHFDTIPLITFMTDAKLVRMDINNIQQTLQGDKLTVILTKVALFNKLPGEVKSSFTKLLKSKKNAYIVLLNKQLTLEK